LLVVVSGRISVSKDAESGGANIRIPSTDRCNRVW